MKNPQKKKIELLASISSTIATVYPENLQIRKKSVNFQMQYFVEFLGSSIS